MWDWLLPWTKAELVECYQRCCLYVSITLIIYECCILYWFRLWFIECHTLYIYRLAIELIEYVAIFIWLILVLIFRRINIRLRVRGTTGRFYCVPGSLKLTLSSHARLWQEVMLSVNHVLIITVLLCTITTSLCDIALKSITAACSCYHWC